MNRQFLIFQVVLVILILVMINLSLPLLAQEETKKEEQKEDPVRGISVTLPIYSGRMNPQWWLTDGPEFKKVLELIKSMKAVNDSLFDYDKWNIPGNAAFRLVSREIKGIPRHIHIWRDMAYIPADDEKSPRYAKNVLELYDLLVKQAEAKGYSEYFRNYHKYREDFNR